ncbi:MAG: ABC transporter permease [Flavobacteriaceae bacterium]
MIKNYFKIAWRNLKANRLFSVINILGLSLGLTITILLFLFIRHELSFDEMYAEKENIYRLLTDQESDGGREIAATSPAIAAPMAMDEIPEIKYAARMLQNDFGGTASVRANNENFTEKSFFWVDQELLDIFKVQLVKGQRNNALNRPNTIVLSESAAKKYFGAMDPLGKMIKVDNRYELEVTGVYSDFEANSTLDCGVMASFSTLWFAKKPTWYNLSFETYLLLNPNTDPLAVETKMKELLDKGLEKQDQWYDFRLQPFETIHLHSTQISHSYASNMGDISEVHNLTFLAVLILLIACINYMNLTTAYSQKRSKEVGINKTLGAAKKNLLTRFYMETGVLTAISMGIAVVMAILAIPVFNTVTDQNLNLKLFLKPELLTTFSLIWLVITFVSGSYPALYLSAFSPKTIIQPSYQQGRKNSIIRKSLVVFQFATSVVLIVGVLLIHRQLQFINEQDLGFKPENVMAISTSGIRGAQQTSALVHEFESLTDVKSVSMAQGFPGMSVSGRTLRKKNDGQEGLDINTNVTDSGIIDVLQLKLLAGQNLPAEKQEGDKLVDVILNKKAVDYLGYSPKEAIGKEVHISVTNRIVGVVDDFNFSSLHVPISAYAFHNNTGEPKSYLLVRFRSNGLSKTIAQFENVFQKVAPESSFDYSFLDKNIEKLYKRERRAAQVGIIFCGLAIFVACLGLLGLAAFTAAQRKKEIGIRKVLGASILAISRMLLTDFLKPISVSLAIGFPIAYFLMNRWLQHFAYHIQISWTVFLIAGFSVVLIALVTISFQSIRAATQNPVKSLRTE